MGNVQTRTAVQSIVETNAVELLKAENHILELLARNLPLDEVLDDIARSAESLVGNGVFCSILLLDDAGETLLHGAAPSLPRAYNDKIHGIKIGTGVGSCGTAAATAEEVVVEDVMTHPYWQAFRELAAEHNLRACWSTPILSSQKEVLGTFAMYHQVPTTPSQEARVVVQLLSRTTALVLERDKAERQKKASAEKVEALYRTGLALSADHELHSIVQTATDAAREVSRAAFGAFFYNTINERGESYMLYTISGVPREEFSKFPMPRNTAVFAPTFGGEGVVRSDDITKDPRYGHNAPRRGMPEGHLPVRSYLAVPVSARNGEVIGGMFFGHPKPAIFTAEAERLVSSIAAQAGVAMENARLHERLTDEVRKYTESESRLRSAQQAARLATWEWRMADDSVSFVPGSAEIFGVPNDQIRTHVDWFEQVVPEDRRAVLDVCMEAVDKNEDYQVEYRVQRQGEVRWILTRGHPVWEAEQNKPSGVIGLSTDITDRKISELALIESQEIFRRAQESANLGSWYWDIINGTVTWSAEVPTLKRISEKASFEGWMERIHPEDQPTIRKIIEEALTKGGDFTIEGRLIINPEEKPRWFLTSGRISMENGVAVSAVGITMDITERKVAEHERSAAEARFRMVLESSELGFWYCDLPFDELLWDAKVKEHFWFRPDDKITIEDFFARLHPDDRERTKACIEHSIATHTQYDTDYRTVSPISGEVKWIRAVGRTVYNQEGAPISFDGITMDLTDRKRSQEVLQASEKLAATGRLAATIAHEINNPLEAVTNFIYLAKSHKELPARVKSHLDLADQELARVTHIAQQTLGFYRDTTEPVQLSVPTVIEDVITIYKRKLEYKSIRVIQEMSANLLITGLQGEIRQIFSNLIANAIDASDEGGQIHIRGRLVQTRTPCPGVRVSIADYGHGIPQSLAEKIFTPFFTTKKDVGTGLGLWVTKGMIEKHGGHIRFRSQQGSRHGTVFSVFLPFTHVIRAN